MNRVANSRHQLSTLLKQAYDNREALEEQIAQGKRNRKEAGNKYGKHINLFFWGIIVTECTIWHKGFWSFPTYVGRLHKNNDKPHAPVFCTLTKATIPMTFPSQHHSWIVWSSVQVPFIVKLRLTKRGFIARYLKWLNWTWGKWNITDSNIIWAVSGPCTRRSANKIKTKPKCFICNQLYLGTLLLFDSIPCQDGYGVHWTSRQNNGKGWPETVCIWM